MSLRPVVPVTDPAAYERFVAGLKELLRDYNAHLDHEYEQWCQRRTPVAQSTAKERS
jgi:hypothetical protein